MVYSILEANMERLEKKLTRIQNKCKRFGCSFTYEKVGEEFKTLKDERGVEYKAKFILIEAEGKAVLNDWVFVASVQHTEKGNIINSTGCSIEVPERYYTSEPICEHCNSKRARKDTYIVMNQVTGEFKQVGKSCLKDFTQGMDASMIAQYYSFFDELVKGEEPWQGCWIEPHYDLKEFLCYARQLCGQYSEYKLQAFRELVESTQDRLIVFYNFTAEYLAMVQIAEELGRPQSIVNGQQKQLLNYEQYGNSITFIQYQAGAMGLNLQKANKIIYFTLTDKSELYEQSKKRIHRIGQEQPCFYYILMCRGSMEEAVLQTLEMRKDFTDELFNEYERMEK